MRFLLLSLIIWSITPFGYALETDAAQPIYVEADKAFFNRPSGINTYEGNVLITQGSSHLNADKVVTYNDKNNNVENLIATGKPARYQTQTDKNKLPLISTALTIKYNVKERYVNLIGEAHAQQGEDKIDGPVLIYKLDDKSISAPSQPIAGRTVFVLHPKK